MPVTVPIQTRLDIALAKALDARAKEAGTTRAEVVRELLAAALAAPQPSVPTIDPVMDRILDALARLAVKVDACGEASEHAAVNAFAAYATTRLHALKMLPQEQQRPFVEQLAPNVARVVQP